MERTESGMWQGLKWAVAAVLMVGAGVGAGEAAQPVGANPSAAATVNRPAVRPALPPAATTRPPVTPPTVTRPPVTRPATRRPAAVRPPVAPPAGNAARRPVDTTPVMPSPNPPPIILQPPQRTWGPGGPVAAGAALGFMAAGLAVPVAGPAPAPNMCWFYTTPARNIGFWADCP